MDFSVPLLFIQYTYIWYMLLCLKRTNEPQKKILKYYNDYINNGKQSTYSNYLVVGSHYRIQNNINDIFHVFWWKMKGKYDIYYSNFRFLSVVWMEQHQSINEQQRRLLTLRRNDLLAQSSTETLLEMLKSHAGIKDCSEETVLHINEVCSELNCSLVASLCLCISMYWTNAQKTTAREGVERKR